MGRAVTFYELAPIVDCAWGRGFSLRKEDGVAEVLDGLEAGAVLQLAPGEEGRGGVERLQGAAPSR